MPTPAHSDGDATGTTLTDTQFRILSYLHERVDETTYFKSRSLAEELGLSAKEVGVNLGILEDRTTGICIEQWGRSSSTTWKVTESR